MDEYSFNTNFIGNLLPATSLGTGIFTISALEVHEGGLKWSTLFFKFHENGLSSMGIIMLTSILSSLIFITLIATIEIICPDKQKHKNWNYLFQYFWKKELPMIRKVSGSIEKNSPNDCIKIKNLTKIYKRNKKVIDGVNFKIPNNQITVLLGFNQSGKSTIMSILRREFEPTSGKVELSQNFDPSLMGICSEQNELFKEFTILDQLIFTCKLRGLTEEEALDESEKYLGMFFLMSYSHCKINELPLEVFREVSVINAVCGNPTIVLLDEPTKGLNVEAKKQIWDLLHEEKKTKTIVLATKCSSEAEAVSDRIILLKNGKVQASGSLSRIKEKFGIGYRLVCKRTSQTYKITECLKLFVPTIQVDEENKRSVTYILDDIYLPKFPKMLAVLEAESENLGISHMKIYNMTLGDILVR